MGVPFDPVEVWTIDTVKDAQSLATEMTNEYDNLRIEERKSSGDTIVVRSTKAHGLMKSLIVGLQPADGLIEAHFQHESSARTSDAKEFLEQYR